MDMIGHQAIRMQRALRLLHQLTQGGQIDKAVRFFTEAIGAIHAALNYVERHSGQ
jgi:hypothetical protein